jgi:hypothetical protein
MLDQLTHPIFHTDHYAGTTSEKLMRSFELGPRYYLRDVPRYWNERRSIVAKSTSHDWEVLWNPLAEFGFLSNEPLAPPPLLDEVMDQLHDLGFAIALKPERFIAICTQWWQAARGDALVIELGSHQGATGLALALLGRKHGFNQQVHLFDLFGKPFDLPMLPVDGVRKYSEFEMDANYADKLAAIAQSLGLGERLVLHPGAFVESFATFVRPLLPCRFAHVDANLYQSTKEACTFIKPLLIEGSTVVFDDYHAITDLGARLAIDETFGHRHGKLRRLSGTSAVLRYEAD